LELMPESLPSMEVFLSNGKHCFSFQQKELVNNDD